MKQTETLNEKMDIIARAGLELSEEELEAIAGGNQKRIKRQPQNGSVMNVKRRLI